MVSSLLVSVFRFHFTFAIVFLLFIILLLLVLGDYIKATALYGVEPARGDVR